MFFEARKRINTLNVRPMLNQSSNKVPSNMLGAKVRITLRMRTIMAHIM
jgi:hypothetical protein